VERAGTNQTLRALGTCSGCCGSCPSQRSAPGKDPSPAPTDDPPAKCDCICGGAITSLANHADFATIASSQAPPVAVALPGSVVFAIYESDYHPPPDDAFAPSGRMLRKLFMSLIC